MCRQLSAEGICAFQRILSIIRCNEDLPGQRGQPRPPLPFSPAPELPPYSPVRILNSEQRILNDTVHQKSRTSYTRYGRAAQSSPLSSMLRLLSYCCKV